MRDKAYFLPLKRVAYECAGCGRQVEVIAGTIFEQSKKPLALWFRAIFEVTASKQGISAAELHRKLGVGSYQTAWSWLQKIRTTMVRPNRQPLSGEVEIDETYPKGRFDVLRVYEYRTRFTSAVGSPSFCSPPQREAPLECYELDWPAKDASRKLGQVAFPTNLIYSPGNNRL